MPVDPLEVLESLANAIEGGNNSFDVPGIIKDCVRALREPPALMDTPLGLMQRTGRGFEIITFTDANGYQCSLQQSSIAHFAQPGSSAIWLGINEVPDQRMHLRPAQVEALTAHLRLWIHSASFVPSEDALEQSERLRTPQGKE